MRRNVDRSASRTASGILVVNKWMLIPRRRPSFLHKWYSEWYGLDGRISAFMKPEYVPLRLQSL